MSNHSGKSDSFDEDDAFEEEEEIEEAQIDEKNIDESQNLDLQEINQPIRNAKPENDPNFMPLVSSGYSLEPDMIFGWKPKNLLNGGPIPLYFNYEEHPDVYDPTHRFLLPVVYHGFRPKNTLVMHQEFCKNDQHSYRFKFASKENAFYLNLLRSCPNYEGDTCIDTRDFEGMNPELREEPLEFDSKFESGNLDKVVRRGDFEYDLFMRVDSNTRGHHQWFNFKMNVKRKGKYRFNIENFTKRDSLYNQGMKVNVWSQKYNEANQSDVWVRSGENYKYQWSRNTREHMRKGNKPRKFFYSVSFDYEFTEEDDVVYFAYAIPYTFSRLSIFLNKVISELPESSKIIRREILCKSLSGVEVPMLTVTNFEVAASLKQYIVMTGRIHPGETIGSWMMQGFIKFVLGNSVLARQLRDRVVFKIIPMVNPDGVIGGNYRSSACGADLNRKFQQPDQKLHPIVCALKELVKAIMASGAAKQKQNLARIAAYVDLHGHSRKKNVFIYGPYQPVHSKKYLAIRVIPKLLAERTQMFRYHSCKFRNQRSKKRAARIVLSKEYNITNCYTVEGSFHGFLNANKETIPFNEANLGEMGKIIGETFTHYLILKEEEEKAREAARIKRQQKKNRRKKLASLGPGLSEVVDQSTAGISFPTSATAATSHKTSASISTTTALTSSAAAMIASGQNPSGQDLSTGAGRRNGAISAKHSHAKIGNASNSYSNADMSTAVSDGESGKPRRRVAHRTRIDDDSQRSKSPNAVIASGMSSEGGSVDQVRNSRRHKSGFSSRLGGGVTGSMIVQEHKQGILHGSRDLVSDDESVSSSDDTEFLVSRHRLRRPSTRATPSRSQNAERGSKTPQVDAFWNRPDSERMITIGTIDDLSIDSQPATPKHRIQEARGLKSMATLLREIESEGRKKKVGEGDEADEDEQSDHSVGSDSDADDEDLTMDEQTRLNKQIYEVLDRFADYSNAITQNNYALFVPRKMAGENKNARMDYALPEYKAESEYAQYFSRADGSEKNGKKPSTAGGSSRKSTFNITTRLRRKGTHIAKQRESRGMSLKNELSEGADSRNKRQIIPEVHDLRESESEVNLKEYVSIPVADRKKDPPTTVKNTVNALLSIPSSTQKVRSSEKSLKSQTEKLRSSKKFSTTQRKSIKDQDLIVKTKKVRSKKTPNSKSHLSSLAELSDLKSDTPKATKATVWGTDTHPLRPTTGSTSTRTPLLTVVKKQEAIRMSREIERNADEPRRLRKRYTKREVGPDSDFLDGNDGGVTAPGAGGRNKGQVLSLGGQKITPFWNVGQQSYQSKGSSQATSAQASLQFGESPAETMTTMAAATSSRKVGNKRSSGRLSGNQKSLLKGIAEGEKQGGRSSALAKLQSVGIGYKKKPSEERHFGLTSSTSKDDRSRAYLGSEAPDLEKITLDAEANEIQEDLPRKIVQKSATPSKSGGGGKTQKSLLTKSQRSGPRASMYLPGDAKAQTRASKETVGKLLSQVNGPIGFTLQRNCSSPVVGEYGSEQGKRKALREDSRRPFSLKSNLTNIEVLDYDPSGGAITPHELESPKMIRNLNL